MNESAGEVAAIFIASEGERPMTERREVRAIAGRGLEGDRYFSKNGSFSHLPSKGGSREVTLIEAEAIEAANRDYDLEMGLGDPRRNIVTRGIPLNHLVGEVFTVGEVRVRGMKLCEPCAHMEGLVARGARKALVHRGGLRAQILTDGTIKVGDSITAST